MSTDGQLPTPAKLRGGLRFAAVMGALLCSFIGALAGGEAMTLMMGPPSAAELGDVEKQLSGSWMTPEGLKALEVAREIQLGTLQNMRGSRTFILSALSLVCAMGFVSSLRLLRPAGLPREGARRTLVFACVVSAVLRTMDGAQQTVVVQRSAPPVLEAFQVSWEKTQPLESVEPVRRLVRLLVLAYPVGLTVFVAGSFALLGQVFRSERVRKRIEELDAREV